MIKFIYKYWNIKTLPVLKHNPNWNGEVITPIDKECIFKCTVSNIYYNG